MSSKEEEFLNEQEIWRLKEVCSYELRQNHGSFLKAFFEAFLRADPANSRILLPAMKALEAKYNLVNVGDSDPKPAL